MEKVLLNIIKKIKRENVQALKLKPQLKIQP